MCNFATPVYLCEAKMKQVLLLSTKSQENYMYILHVYAFKKHLMNFLSVYLLSSMMLYVFC